MARPPESDAEVRRITRAWLALGTSLSADEQLAAIKNALYAYRNKQIEKKDLAPELVSDDPEVMAAVEHYFFARSQVASGEYSRANMKAMIIGYQIAKALGIDMRHNKANPTTPPSSLQRKWALAGTDQGDRDLQKSNAIRRANKQPVVEPPAFRLPPNFTGSYGSMRTDRFKY